MERLEHIATVEYEFRQRGVFLLVDPSNRKIWFYGYKPNTVLLNQMIASLKGRTEEMVNFLIARVGVRKGETR